MLGPFMYAIQPVFDLAAPSSLALQDNKQAIFNPWCSCTSLLDYLKKKCDCANIATIDLIDMDGQVTNLSEHPKEYAYPYVGSRSTYILVKVEKQNGTNTNGYFPLLDDLDMYHPELADKLRATHQTKNEKRRSNKWNLMKNVTKFNSHVSKTSRSNKRESDASSKK
ncbi:hypothetical protein LSAT2_025703 [Lamellibrachia satsuma]|nr:hypothetical protein LSAT2_025703 [Lamellibrachia satsuma]